MLLFTTLTFSQARENPTPFSSKFVLGYKQWHYQIMVIYSDNATYCVVAGVVSFKHMHTLHKYMENLCTLNDLTHLWLAIKMQLFKTVNQEDCYAKTSIAQNKSSILILKLHKTPNFEIYYQFVYKLGWYVLRISVVLEDEYPWVYWIKLNLILFCKMCCIQCIWL